MLKKIIVSPSPPLSVPLPLPRCCCPCHSCCTGEAGCRSAKAAAGDAGSPGRCAGR